MLTYTKIVKSEEKTCVALGFFDGVHIGHKAVISGCIDYCTKHSNCSAAVFTFLKSPRCVLGNDDPRLLVGNEKKQVLIEALGAEKLYLVDFSSVQALSPQDFVRCILQNKLNAQAVFCGYNYRFGKGKQADVQTLKELCSQQGIEVFVCDKVMYNGEAVSSTRIREYISSGKIEEANRLLGYNFSFGGVVTSGNRIGKKIDSPTINIALNSDIITPLFGVYRTKVTIDGKVYTGATNIGVHPTVGGDTPLCETWLLDFESGDLYGKAVQVELLNFIRREQKFSSIDMLRKQIKQDRLTILSQSENDLE